MATRSPFFIFPLQIPRFFKSMFQNVWFSADYWDIELEIHRLIVVSFRSFSCICKSNPTTLQWKKQRRILIHFCRIIYLDDMYEGIVWMIKESSLYVATLQVIQINGFDSWPNRLGFSLRIHFRMIWIPDQWLAYRLSE